MKDVKTCINEIDVLERRLKIAKENFENAIRAENSKDPQKELAVYLHDKLCNWNHTDGCGWHYFVKKGVHDWTEASHARYLRSAEVVISRLKGLDIPEDKAYEVAKAILEKT